MAQVHRQDNATIVEMGREYDALDDASIRRANDVLLAQAQGSNPPLLVVDLSKTTYMGSAFIEVLFRAWKRVSERQGRMVLCGVQPFCAAVLRAARLDSLWDSYATREEAVAALR